MLSLAGHPQQALDVLLVLVPGLGVPEGDGGVGAVLLGVAVQYSTVQYSTVQYSTCLVWQYTTVSEKWVHL